MLPLPPIWAFTEYMPISPGKKEQGQRLQAQVQTMGSLLSSSSRGF